MSNFVLTKQHLREVLIFCFNWKKSAAETHRMLVEVYGDTAPTNKSCKEWFRRFKNGDFSVEDKPRSGQPKKFEDKELEALLEEDQSQTQKELAEALRVTQQAVSARHDKVIFLHDNAQPHVAKVVKKYLETFKWDVLPPPPYSPDIAPSDYWLFRRIQHDLASHRFTSFAEIENWLQNWIASTDESFFRDGIRKLPERWEKVVASDGQ
ncbi:Mariner Mos1 transposase [Acromyrmex echinatior]|uniref:Mariner Mos1 transposase n=1 Tax=Acromyrmex echinatior TaxID=103372 RepID=F4WY42_ACREC|nr:Mariner Mos1 transposase [Acromyrmex echinatior]